jgi:predicted signal transduction protein with EAL and GGDEF domain
MAQRHPQAAAMGSDADRVAQDECAIGAVAPDCLRDAGAAIAATVRDGAAVARFGGDEFAVVLRRTSPREARVAAERILRALEGISRASAGLAHLRPGEPIAASEALARADLALYAAKGSEPGGLVEYPSDVEAAVRLRTRLAWGRRLHRALEDDAFAFYAEPVVDLRTGVVEGVELQLHLHDGDEYVPRDAYRDHAVRNGLAERIDRWVLEHAPAPERGDVIVSVSSAVLGVVDPSRLVLAVDHVPRDAEALLEAGVRFALDGLGALAVLRELPCAQIRLAAELGDGPVDLALIRQAVALGEELGIDVAAGGIETTADAARLRALGVRLGQGPLFGGPHPLSRA